MPLGVKALRPADVAVQSDGVCRRPVVRYHPNGDPYTDMRLCCERCWEPLPVYVDAPNGWVSPDSARKLHLGTEQNHAAVEARQKVVCYDCYKADALDMFGVFADFPHAVKE